MRLAEKVALVSGASHGIGKAIALACTRAGADVALTYRNREAGAQDTARQIEALGRRALVMHAEVTEPDACRRIVGETVDLFGQLDVLVNNAGGSRAGPLSELPLENWKYTFDLCVTAAFLTSQAAVHHMIPRGRGSIINISSVHSTHVWPNMSPYGAAKAALGDRRGIVDDIDTAFQDTALVLPLMVALRVLHARAHRPVDAGDLRLLQPLGHGIAGPGEGLLGHQDRRSGIFSLIPGVQWTSAQPLPASSQS